MFICVCHDGVAVLEFECRVHVLLAYHKKEWPSRSLVVRVIVHWDLFQLPSLLLRSGGLPQSPPCSSNIPTPLFPRVLTVGARNN